MKVSAKPFVVDHFGAQLYGSVSDVHIAINTEAHLACAGPAATKTASTAVTLHRIGTPHRNKPSILIRWPSIRIRLTCPQHSLLVWRAAVHHDSLLYFCPNVFSKDRQLWHGGGGARCF